MRAVAVASEAILNYTPAGAMVRYVLSTSILWLHLTRTSDHRQRHGFFCGGRIIDEDKDGPRNCVRASAFFTFAFPMLV